MARDQAAHRIGRRLVATGLAAFEVDLSEQPPTHPPLTPSEGAAVALNPPPMNSQPMRLRTGGRYLLRFMAKGNATHLRATISAVGAGAGKIRIEPTDEWREYRLETDIEPGYTQVHIRFSSGGESNQVVWIDDIEFGPVEKRSD